MVLLSILFGGIRYLLASVEQYPIPLRECKANRTGIFAAYGYIASAPPISANEHETHKCALPTLSSAEPSAAVTNSLANVSKE